MISRKNIAIALLLIYILLQVKNNNQLSTSKDSAQQSSMELTQPGVDKGHYIRESISGSELQHENYTLADAIAIFIVALEIFYTIWGLKQENTALENHLALTSMQLEMKKNHMVTFMYAHSRETNNIEKVFNGYSEKARLAAEGFNEALLTEQEKELLQCPISHCTMTYPLVTNSGHSYDFTALHKLYKTRKDSNLPFIDPLTYEDITWIGPNWQMHRTLQSIQEKGSLHSHMDVPPKECMTLAAL